ncbi:hypothetical protein GQ53DRAFT_97017 [Thozetella sp. PMI_491]|nr:hypothetical protein GQ53DRAFT_97017 [Thozetella sp. PMI_491]
MRTTIQYISPCGPEASLSECAAAGPVPRCPRHPPGKLRQRQLTAHRWSAHSACALALSPAAYGGKGGTLRALRAGMTELVHPHHCSKPFFPGFSCPGGPSSAAANRGALSVGQTAGRSKPRASSTADWRDRCCGRASDCGDRSRRDGACSTCIDRRALVCAGPGQPRTASMPADKR